jgi:hypothetical protein
MRLASIIGRLRRGNASDPSQRQVSEGQEDGALPFGRQPLPQGRSRLTGLAHRVIQANAPGHAVLRSRFSEIRSALSNYQRHPVWGIEQLWRTVKGDGLALDDSQLTEAERLFRLTAMVLGGAVRTLQLVDARDGSPRPATDVLDAELLPAVAQVSRSLEGSTPRQKNPHPPASLAFIAWVAARLGGWNCYGRPPGPKTMRVGWNRLAAMLAGYILAQGSPKPEPKPEALSGMP